MNSLLKKYGHVQLKVGDLLWHENDKFPNMNETMFFLTDTSLSKPSLYGRNLYEFVVVKPVKLVTPFTLHLTYPTRTKSALYNIYKDLCPNAHTPNNVSLKTNMQVRNDIIKYFKSKKIEGWVLPEEMTLYQTEVCLFNPNLYIEPNCRVSRNLKKSTLLNGILGDCNKLDKERFLKSRKENAKYNKENQLIDHSIYDHYFFKKNDK